MFVLLKMLTLNSSFKVNGLVIKKNINASIYNEIKFNSIFLTYGFNKDPLFKDSLFDISKN